MNDARFLDADTVPMKTGDVPTGVGLRYLVDIVRVEPYLALSPF